MNKTAQIMNKTADSRSVRSILVTSLFIEMLIKGKIVVKQLFSAAVFMNQLNNLFHFSCRTQLNTGISYKAINNTAMVSECRLIFPIVFSFLESRNLLQ